MVNAKRFNAIDLKGRIEQANDILDCLIRNGITNEVILELADKEHIKRLEENNDQHMALVWYLVVIQIQEQILCTDPHELHRDLPYYTNGNLP